MPSWPQEIVVVEPAKTGYSHAIFNASLLESVRYAFPETPIRFHAHESHLQWVKESLQVSASDVESVSFVAETLTNLPGHKWKRAWREWQRYRSLYRRLGGARQLLVFASVSPSGLFALKMPVPFTRHRRTLITIHCLQALTKPRTRLRDLPLDLARILQMRLRNGLLLVALGESLVKNARELIGDFECDWVDIPRLKPQRPAIQKQARPTFAFVGGTAKGFDIFESLSRQYRDHETRPRFLLAGFVNSDLADDIGDFVEGASREPISQEELENRLMQSHYVVWTAEPDVYRLTASATFADAVCFGVPVIALRNSFMEHYFEQVGEAGVLCEDGAEMSRHTKEILDGWLGNAASEHDAATRRIATKFLPASVGTQIQALKWL